MLKKITGAMILALTVTTAHSADLLRGPIHHDVPIEYDWSGYYIGLSGGYGKYSDIDLRPGIDGFKSTGEDVNVAVHAGANYQFSKVVVGVEADYMRYNSEFDVLPPILPLLGISHVVVEDIMSIRGRLGYAYGRFLPYVTGGYTYATTNLTDFDGDGLAYGVGLEYAVNEHIVAGIQYVHHDYSDFGDEPVEVDLDLVQARLSAKF